MKIKEGTVFICLEPYVVAGTGEIIAYGELVKYSHLDENGYWFISASNSLFNISTIGEVNNHLEFY